MRTPEKGNPSRSATLAGLERRGASNAAADLDRAKSVAPAAEPEAVLTARPGRGLKASPSRVEPASPDAAGTSRAAPAAGRPAPAGLPCLSSNNCTETPLRTLSQQHRKSACALAWNVQALVDRYGIEAVGFLTLTFADPVMCPKAAQQRFHSLATHVLKSRYREYIRVSERQKSGRLHYHLLVVMPDGIDIRTGCDFDAFARGVYRSAPPALRAEWTAWRVTAPRYRFGRTELLPVRSTSEGIARYVGKYISKGVANRNSMDHGARLVEYSRGARIANTKFAWATSGATAWRNKVALFARIVVFQQGIEPVTYDDLSVLLGRDWAYRHRDFIAALPEQQP